MKLRVCGKGEVVCNETWLFFLNKRSTMEYIVSSSVFFFYFSLSWVLFLGRFWVCEWKYLPLSPIDHQLFCGVIFFPVFGMARFDTENNESYSVLFSKSFVQVNYYGHQLTLLADMRIGRSHLRNLLSFSTISYTSYTHDIHHGSMYVRALPDFIIVRVESWLWIFFIGFSV